MQDPRVRLFTLSRSAGQPCYTAPPRRSPGASCSHPPQQDFSSSTFRPTAQTEGEMLSPFPFPSLGRLLFKETLPSKKGIAAALGFPPTMHAASLWRCLSKDLLSGAVWKTKSVVPKSVGSTKGWLKQAAWQRACASCCWQKARLHAVPPCFL